MSEERFSPIEILEGMKEQYGEGTVGWVALAIAINALQEKLARAEPDIGITATENAPLALDELRGMDGE